MPTANSPLAPELAEVRFTRSRLETRLRSDPLSDCAFCCSSAICHFKLASLQRASASWICACRTAEDVSDVSEATSTGLIIKLVLAAGEIGVFGCTELYLAVLGAGEIGAVKRCIMSQ